MSYQILFADDVERDLEDLYRYSPAGMAHRGPSAFSAKSKKPVLGSKICPHADVPKEMLAWVSPSTGNCTTSRGG